MTKSFNERVTETFPLSVYLALLNTSANAGKIDVHDELIKFNAHVTNFNITKKTVTFSFTTADDYVKFMILYGFAI